MLEKCQPFFKILSKKDKKIFWLIIAVQFIIAVFDIIAIALVGIVGILVTSYVIDAELQSQLAFIIQMFSLQKFSDKTLIFGFTFMVVVLFMVKTGISITVNRRILLFYARQEEAFSVLLYSKLLNSPYAWLKRQDSERVHTAIITGSNAIFMRVFSSTVLVVSDLFLLFLILFLLVLISPIVSIFTFMFFGFFVIVLHKMVAKKAEFYGKVNTENLSKSYTYLSVLMLSFREIYVMNKREYFAAKFRNSENARSLASAQGLWLQLLPKYVFEIALVLGIFVLSFYLLASDISNISLLAIFIVASGRIVPALFRIQSSVFNVLLGYSDALNAINFMEETNARNFLVGSKLNYVLKNAPSIGVQEISFKFPDAEQNTIRGISLSLSSGNSLALVGKSGSGKTTLVDLILNIYTPSSGKIQINDGTKQITPGNISNIAYIPQNPVILKGTILENIAFGNDSKDVDLISLNYAIQATDLDKLLKKIPGGINAELNNLGGFLSGGEKQRIAIARALYLKPKLMIIDEGTSSLDITSENFITNFLSTLKGQVTLIFIAHRIHTVKSVDQIYFIENGIVKGSGDFEALKKSVPEFGYWANSTNPQAGFLQEF